MSCKSNIFVANTQANTVAAGGTLPLSTVVRRRGCELSQSGNSVAIADCGSNYYLVLVNATFTAAAAGVATLSIQQNGSAVTAGTASTTITTATTEVRSLTIPVIVRTFNSCGIDAITVVNTGTIALNFTNIAVEVIKL